MSKIYHEIFDPERQKVFDTLSEFKNCYLAGGTALALQIGHRRSYDFDIFSPDPLTPSLVKKTREMYGDDITIRISNSDFLLLETPAHVGLHFVYYWFPLLKKTIPTTSLSLASVEDISADKAHTIGRRAEWRDYADLFFILKYNILPFDTVISNAQKKYGPEFNIRLFLEQLTYWGDIKDFSITFLQKQFTTEEVQVYLENVAARELKRRLKKIA